VLAQADTLATSCGWEESQVRPIQCDVTIISLIYKFNTENQYQFNKELDDVAFQINTYKIVNVF
jgi:hypothetical protein